MAGTKINTKSKGREEKTKGNKGANPTTEESEDLDYTLLRKPILTSVTGFAQARKIFDFATEELKSLLSTECDLLYECKVCRNLFRSLANFISHKRIYCKEKFNSSIHSHFIKPSSTSNEIMQIKRIEEEYQDLLKIKNETASINSDETEDRIPLTKDLTAIVEKISLNKSTNTNLDEEPELHLQKIPNTSVAVFQNVHYNKDTQCDIRSQVTELDTILSQDKAVLQSDGRFTIQNTTGPKKSNAEQENVIQISDDDDTESNNILKCKICDLQFSTQKTLKFHMKYKHLESRLVYPCPDCLEIFSTSWSVYRHLFKVHRKTAAQIRRLRESIQAKAFRMNNPPAFYEKRKNNIKSTLPAKISEEERLDQENQAWMDNMEGDGEIPRCGGCGRTFERRAALAAHTHTCQPRSRALARRADTKKIEIQIRKDYNKGPAVVTLPVKTTDANDNKLVNDDLQTSPKPSLKESPKEEEIPEPVINNVNEESIERENVSPEKKIEIRTENFIARLPFAQQIEKNNLAALKIRLQPDTDLEKLLCKKCDTKCDQLQELYDHMAGHYKWMRYACKLCNFKHYNFEKLPEHVKIVHKLKGDTDFYFSTVRAVDATKALELCEPQTEDITESNETSPDSRRPSRCSSDSSRLSDDSSSSSTRVEVGAKKRKINTSRNIVKKRKEATNDEPENKKCDDILIEKRVVEIESPSNAKVFEENSSDMDDIEEKIAKTRSLNEANATISRRPVRKRTRPKNEDFEYDLSNLLKMEAQGYRDSQSGTNTKSTQSKKKTQLENQINYENANKDCFGALDTLSKKAVENSAAHMKILSFAINTAHKEQRLSNVFIRPMLPKVSRSEKTSPKKDLVEESKEVNVNVPNKKAPEVKVSPSKDKDKEKEKDKDKEKDKERDKIKLDDTLKPPVEDTSTKDLKVVTDNEKIKHNPVISTCETVKTSFNIPAVVPLKFRRQSLDVIKNPIINKNISDLTKAGMKTKILVIKPINRNKDGTKSMTPLKFQTIKLKDPTKGNSSTEEKSNDQVVVVQVPKVERAVTLPTIILPNTINSDTTEGVKKDESRDCKSSESACEEKEKVIANELCHVQNTISESVPPVSESTSSDKVHLNEIDKPIESTT